MRRIRPALKWYGGKYYLCRKVIAMFPDHKVYCEPCAGGLSVLLNKPVSPVEIASDIHPGLIEFYTVLRDRCDELCGLLRSMGYYEQVFDQRYVMMASADPVVRAAGFLVSNRMSHGGKGKHFSWSDKTNVGGKQDFPGTWNGVRSGIPETSERIQDVRLVCNDVIQTVYSVDSSDTLIYYDPPYVHESRVSKDVYDFEMSDRQHSAVLNYMMGCKSKIVISGYQSNLYNSLLGSWNVHEIPIVCHNTPVRAGSRTMKERRTEVLWTNF